MKNLLQLNSLQLFIILAYLKCEKDIFTVRLLGNVKMCGTESSKDYSFQLSKIESIVNSYREKNKWLFNGIRDT